MIDKGAIPDMSRTDQFIFSHPSSTPRGILMQTFTHQSHTAVGRTMCNAHFSVSDTIKFVPPCQSKRTRLNSASAPCDSQLHVLGSCSMTRDRNQIPADETNDTPYAIRPRDPPWRGLRPEMSPPRCPAHSGKLSQSSRALIFRIITIRSG